MLPLGPLAIRWYGFFITLGILFGIQWAITETKRRHLDPEKLLDMTVWLVIAGLIGARLVYVLTSPSAFFGEYGTPWKAFAIWEGGISIHGGVLGIVLATWIYSRIHKLNMWAYLDVMTPTGALGIIGGRIGNFMNGTDTTGRLTNSPLGFQWPEAGTETFGAFGNWFFSSNLWSCGAPEGANYCPQYLLQGPTHPTQLYGMMVGVFLIFILLWAFRRSQTPGFVFWQFILWYSILRSVIEEPFRNNPLFGQVFLSEGVDAVGVGLFTLTQLASVPIILVALYILLTMKPPQKEKGKA